jgi:hypothetical protein
MTDAALTARLRSAAEIVARDARRRSARWSRRVPGSVRLQGGRRSVTIVAGGKAAPQAYTMEGRKSGAPVSHPVYGHGPRKGWTWVKQVPRPFLREAIDSQSDAMLREFANVIDDWAKARGFR